MNYFHAYGPAFDRTKTLPHLQRTILERTRTGTMKCHGYDDIEITATLKDVAEAVESAYILTAKADLPKVTSSELGGVGVSGLPGLVAYGSTTAESARKRANAWLAIAKHLEAKEAARAYEEAKAKAVAEAAAAAAKQARLNELADEWFGKDYTDLGPNKAAAINEIHRLETRLNTKDAA